MVALDIHIRNLSVRFKDRSGPFFRPRSYCAVNNVSLDIHGGETFCLLGESGSGKTTLAWALLGLLPFHGGSVVFNGQTVNKSNDSVHRGLRAVSQMVFQKPAASLNPFFPLNRSIAEPLRAKGVNAKQRAATVRDLASRTGLVGELLHRRPRQVSGGQNQRACIARALSTRPSLLILDEPLTALDAIAQHQVVELLDRIKAEFELTYFLITHDLGLAKKLGTRVAVMYLGTIVEKAPVDAFFSNPCHPYAKALLSSSFTPGVWHGDPIVLDGEIPSIQAPPSGCVFHPRCFAKMDICDKLPPEEITVGKAHVVRCHRFRDKG